MNPTLRTKRNNVLVEEPNIQSLAALVLLIKKLSTNHLDDWLKFRLQFLNSHKLTCFYCGKENLLIEVPTTKKSDLSKLATIDHIKPLSKDGKEFDFNNCVVACYNCNQKKGNNENFNFRRFL